LISDSIERASAFIVINRLNDFHFGMITLHVIGLISKQKSLLLIHSEEQKRLLSEVYKIHLFSEQAIKQLVDSESKNSCVEFSAIAGEYAYIFHEDSDIQEDVLPRDNLKKPDTDRIIAACRRGIETQDEKLTLVAFGALARATFNEGEFGKLMSSIVNSIHRQCIDNSTIQKSLAEKALGMHASVTML